MTKYLQIHTIGIARQSFAEYLNQCKFRMKFHNAYYMDAEALGLSDTDTLLMFYAECSDGEEKAILYDELDVTDLFK